MANWAPGAQRSSQGYYRGLAVRAVPLEAPSAAPHEAGSESVTGAEGFVAEAEASALGGLGGWKGDSGCPPP